MRRLRPCRNKAFSDTQTTPLLIRLVQRLPRISPHHPQRTVGKAITVNLHLNRAHDRPASALLALGEREVMVDLTHDDDLSFWTQQLSCSAEKLLAAVESVGPRVEHVTEYLRAGW
jgi:hypothetical protein